MTPNLEGPWRTVNERLEMNKSGIVRIKENMGTYSGKYLLPIIRNGAPEIPYYKTTKNHAMKVSRLYREVWGEYLTTGAAWTYTVREMVKNENKKSSNHNRPARRIRMRHNERPCHDCGKPTVNYRCAECWLAIRGEVTEDYTTQYPGRSAYAGAATLYCDSEAGGLV